uniref:Uncharacterized protein n=1 Tax=Peronospora matthiolae TaxID=2874970 RepID=A0AAV1VFR5_9STRA
MLAFFRPVTLELLSQAFALMCTIVSSLLSSTEALAIKNHFPPGDEDPIVS